MLCLCLIEIPLSGDSQLSKVNCQQTLTLSVRYGRTIRASLLFSTLRLTRHGTPCRYNQATAIMEQTESRAKLSLSYAEVPPIFAFAKVQKKYDIQKRE